MTTYTHTTKKEVCAQSLSKPNSITSTARRTEHNSCTCDAPRGNPRKYSIKNVCVCRVHERFNARLLVVSWRIVDYIFVATNNIRAAYTHSQTYLQYTTQDILDATARGELCVSFVIRGCSGATHNLEVIAAALVTWGQGMRRVYTAHD